MDLENPYIAEELYWFVYGDENRLRDYQEMAYTEGGMSIAEYVKHYCLSEFVQAMKEKGYE